MAFLIVPGISYKIYTNTGQFFNAVKNGEYFPKVLESIESPMKCVMKQCSLGQEISVAKV